MIAVLGVTGPIFAMVGLGWFVTRVGMLDPAAIRALGRYVVNLALPALIFRAVTARDLGTLFDGPYLAAYLAGSLGVFALAYGLALRAGTGDGRTATFRAIGSSCSNSGFIGYPILLIALPHAADAALALNMIVENLVMIPLTLILAERARPGARVHPGRILRRLVANPIVLSLVAGLVVSLSPLSVPRLLDQMVNLLALSSAAVSLVVIGGSLVGAPRVTDLGRVATVAASKLLAHPLAVAGVFALLGLAGVALDPDLVAAGVLLAAMPAMGVYPILAAQYGEGPPAAVALMAMTVLSFFTLGALIWALGTV